LKKSLNNVLAHHYQERMKDKKRSCPKIANNMNLNGIILFLK